LRHELKLRHEKLRLEEVRERGTPEHGVSWVCPCENGASILLLRVLKEFLRESLL
jgi:hypothetical protein